jgi:hypothetical protein
MDLKNVKYDWLYLWSVCTWERAIKKKCTWQQLTCDNWIVTSLYSLHCQNILSDWPICWSKILLEWLLRQSSHYLHLWNPKVHYHIHKNPSMVLVMSQIYQSPHPPILFLEDPIYCYTALYVGPLTLINDMPSSNHALNYNYSTYIALPQVVLNVATQDQPLMPV